VRIRLDLDDELVASLDRRVGKPPISSAYGSSHLLGPPAKALAASGLRVDQAPPAGPLDDHAHAIGVGLFAGRVAEVEFRD
jgi:hypothetical protein